jgi:hypothetical protein
LAVVIGIDDLNGQAAGKEPGAPKITVRFDPDVHEWLKAHPEGARALIQELVRERMAKEAGSPGEQKRAP